MLPFLVILLLALGMGPCQAAKDFYCGDQTCYELLDVSKTATTSEIKKAYYKLSLAHHPDKVKQPTAETKAKYLMIQKAWEILKDDEARAEYDSFLEHPERYIQNYARYYARTYQISPWTVLFGLLTFATICDWLYRGHRHRVVMGYVRKQTQVQNRMRAIKLERLKQMQDDNAPKGKKRKTIDDIPDDEITNEELGIAVNGWEGRPPRLSDLLPYRMLWLPITVGRFFYAWGRWIIKFWILKHAYGPEEREYVTYSILGMSRTQWETYFDANQRIELANRELWKPENMKEFRREMIQKAKKK